MDGKDLRTLSREELVRLATERGVARPEALTTEELVEAIDARATTPPSAPTSGTGSRKPRGWFTRARDLLTSVLETGFPPPPSTRTSSPPPRAPQASLPLPTVTLAEIYAAQGHFERAIATLNEVLAKEPSHTEAERLKQRFAEQLVKTRPSAPPPPDDATPEAASTEAATLTAASLAAASRATNADARNEARNPAAPTTESDGLPDRYEVDEVVGLAVDARTVYVYWEVRPLTLAGARRRAPDGALTLRVLAVTSSSGGPIASTRDERVDALFGEMYVHDLPAGANVRLTVGWRDASGRFDPLAVALELQTPHVEPARRLAARTGTWTRDVPLLDDDAVASFTAPVRFDRPARAGGVPLTASDGATGSDPFESRAGGPETSEPGSATPGLVRRTRGGSSDLFRKEMRFGASDQLRIARALG